MNYGVQIIGFFRGVIEAFSGLWQWVNTPIVIEGWNIIFTPTEAQVTNAINNGALTPMNLLSILLVAFLTIMLGLHLFHLLKPIG